MRRFQLFEILDQAWCPRAVRDGATDCLEAITSRADIYRPVRKDILAAIRRCGASSVVDLCSGGGGPWLSPKWRSLLEDGLRVALTDKFPSSALCARLKNSSRLYYVEQPVDATAVPEEFEGFRTIFSSFHHFNDAMAAKILRDAVRSHQGFASAEVTSRSLRAGMVMFLMPFFAWAWTPRIQPFRWSRLFFTYLIPAIPFVLLWDGVISCLRTRTPEELLALTRSFPEYTWAAGYAEGQGPLLAPVYLIGRPNSSARDKPPTSVASHP